MIIKYFFPRFVILGNWVDNFHLMKSNWKTFFSHVIMPAAKGKCGQAFYEVSCQCFMLNMSGCFLRKDYIWWKYLVKSLLRQDCLKSIAGRDSTIFWGLITMYRNGNFGLVFGRGEILLTYMIFVYHWTS